MADNAAPSEPICAPIAGVDPALVPHMLKCAMASRYCRAVGPDMTIEEGLDAATATWETEWDTDPAPRTYEHAMQAVDADLEYWGED